MPLLPFDDPKRVSIKTIIIAVVYALITFITLFVSTGQADMPKDFNEDYENTKEIK